MLHSILDSFWIKMFITRERSASGGKSAQRIRGGLAIQNPAATRVTRRIRSMIMDDLAHGARNKRGDWSPSEPAGIAPLFVFPPQPLKFLKWVPHYFFPYNVLFALSAVAWWHWVLPDTEVMKSLAWGWILKLFVVNSIALFLFF